VHRPTVGVLVRTEVVEDASDTGMERPESRFRKGQRALVDLTRRTDITEVAHRERELVERRQQARRVATVLALDVRDVRECEFQRALRVRARHQLHTLTFDA
jgi:hypothetical protein